MKALKVAFVALVISAGATSTVFAEDLETKTLDEIVTWIDQNLSTP